MTICKDSHHFSRTLGSLWWQSLMAALFFVRTLRGRFREKQQFSTSATHTVTKGSLGDVQNIHITTVLSIRHARNDERVAPRTRRMSILPQFWASDTSEVTKGLLGPIQNLHFTSVLGVRHVRSDERVARPRKKFAFYHSFERPTRPKWRKGRSAT